MQLRNCCIAPSQQVHDPEVEEDLVQSADPQLESEVELLEEVWDNPVVEDDLVQTISIVRVCSETAGVVSIICI